MSELEQEMTPLCYLTRHHKSDKGGNHLHAGDTCHRYTPAYHNLFKDRREEVKWVLEIGVNYGCSLRIWRDYFPNAKIIGLDSNKGCLFNEERIRCFAADQFNRCDLLDVVVRLEDPEFDLIVDDGSHVPAHQIFSARMLLPYLAADGVYVIEDLYPDCKPELVGDPIIRYFDWGYAWKAIPTGRGLGKAHCGCGCGQGEQLLVIRHA